MLCENRSTGLSCEKLANGGFFSKFYCNLVYLISSSFKKFILDLSMSYSDLLVSDHISQVKSCILRCFPQARDKLTYLVTSINSTGNCAGNICLKRIVYPAFQKKNFKVPVCEQKLHVSLI